MPRSISQVITTESSAKRADATMDRDSRGYEYDLYDIPEGNNTPEMGRSPNSPRKQDHAMSTTPCQIGRFTKTTLDIPNLTVQGATPFSHDQDVDHDDSEPEELDMPVAPQPLQHNPTFIHTTSICSPKRSTGDDSVFGADQLDLQSIRDSISNPQTPSSDCPIAELCESPRPLRRSGSRSGPNSLIVSQMEAMNIRQNLEAKSRLRVPIYTMTAQRKAREKDTKEYLCLDDNKKKAQLKRVMTSPSLGRMNSSLDLDHRKMPLADMVGLSTALTDGPTMSSCTLNNSLLSLHDEVQQHNLRSATDHNYMPTHDDVSIDYGTVIRRLRRLVTQLNILVLGNSESGKTSAIDNLERALKKNLGGNDEEPISDGKSYKMQERVVYQNKSQGGQSEADGGYQQGYYGTDPLNPRRYPGVAFWDTRGIERIGEFDHARNIIRNILEGHIEPHQFNLALMYRGVPTKESSARNAGQDRLRGVFRNTKRRFHAVLLVCDITKEPPMRLTELLFSALEKSNYYNVNRIPVITLLTHCDTLENCQTETNSSDGDSESGRVPFTAGARSNGSCSPFSTMSRRDSRATNPRKDSLLVPDSNILQVPPDSPGGQDGLMISVSSTDELINKVYMQRAEQMFDSEVLLACASASDHKNCDVYKADDELARFQKLFNYISSNNPKTLKASKDSAANIAIQNLPSFDNLQNSMSGGLGSGISQKSASQKSLNTTGVQRVIRLDSGYTPGATDEELIRTKYYALQAWVNILRLIQPDVKPLKRKAISKTTSFEGGPEDAYGADIGFSTLSGKRAGSMRSLFRRQQHFSEEDQSNKPRGLTWTSGTKASQDIRKQVREAMQKQRQSANDTSPRSSSTNIHSLSPLSTNLSFKSIGKRLLTGIRQSRSANSLQQVESRSRHRSAGRQGVQQSRLQPTTSSRSQQSATSQRSHSGSRRTSELDKFSFPKL